MIKKYVKKSVVIEAFQWHPYMGEIGGVIYKPKGEVNRKPVIETLEGDHMVTAGDYIITGVKGEKYPCKPNIFEMTYEEVK